MLGGKEGGGGQVMGGEAGRAGMVLSAARTRSWSKTKTKQKVQNTANYVGISMDQLVTHIFKWQRQQRELRGNTAGTRQKPASMEIN